MTTIAFDGQVMAADKQSNLGNTPTAKHGNKLFVVQYDGQPWLCGGCGFTSSIARFRRWLEQGASHTFSKPDVDNSFFMLMVNQRKDIILLDDALEFEPTTGVETSLFATEGSVRNVMAVGSGADYALGAMVFGANAYDAVLVATHLDTHTGRGVSVMSLKDLEGL